MVWCYYVLTSQFHFTLPRGFSLPPSHIARVGLMSYSSLFTFVLYLFHGFIYCIMYLFRNSTSLSLAVFHSALPHTWHLQSTSWLFPFTTNLPYINRTGINTGINSRGCESCLRRNPCKVWAIVPCRLRKSWTSAERFFYVGPPAVSIM